MLTNDQIIEFASSHSIVLTLLFIVVVVSGIYFFGSRNKVRL